eukprot:4395422-Alexandrium_andersonii.AAC.1
MTSQDQLGKGLSLDGQPSELPSCRSPKGHISHFVSNPGQHVVGRVGQAERETPLRGRPWGVLFLSLIHISEPTRLALI